MMNKFPPAPEPPKPPQPPRPPGMPTALPSVPAPPPAGIGRSLLPTWILLQAGASVALLLAWSAGFTAQPVVLGMCGAFLGLHISLLGLHGLSAHGLARTALQRLGGYVINSGVGFYGLMTLARFLQLEVEDLLRTLFEDWPGTLRDVVRDWLFGFSMDSMRNSIEAFQWPWKLFLSAGWPWAIGAGAACWIPFALAGRLFPDLAQMLTAETAVTDEDPASSGQTR